ncbi:Imm10 family immunity protein [Streptomyces sp. ME08-AFT2]|nr:Imm10 family immunity protein [Streptomyces sp. ME08-AFT2]
MGPESAFLVGLAENEFGDGSNITLQSGLEEPDSQQRKHGLDTYCILNETGEMQYGGLEAVRLMENCLVLKFSFDAAQTLSLPGRELILGIAPEVDVDALRSGLRRALTWGDPERVPQVLEL